MKLKGSKEQEFGNIFQEIEVGNSKAYFKVKLVKLLGKYPKVKSSSLSLNFFKDYAKSIKEYCKESGDQFKRVFT